MTALPTKHVEAEPLLDERVLEHLAGLLAQKLEPALQRSVMVARSDGAMMSIAEICAYMNLSRTQFYFLRRGEVEIDGESLPPFPSLGAMVAIWFGGDGMSMRG